MGTSVCRMSETEDEVKRVELIMYVPDDMPTDQAYGLGYGSLLPLSDQYGVKFRDADANPGREGNGCMIYNTPAEGGK